MRSLSTQLLSCMGLRLGASGMAPGRQCHVATTAPPAAPNAEAAPNQALRVAFCAVRLRRWAMRPIQEGRAHNPSPAGSSED